VPDNIPIFERDPNDCGVMARWVVYDHGCRGDEVHQLRHALSLDWTLLEAFDGSWWRNGWPRPFGRVCAISAVPSIQKEWLADRALPAAAACFGQRPGSGARQCSLSRCPFASRWRAVILVAVLLGAWDR
jgi:hypothetical protein